MNSHPKYNRIEIIADLGFGDRVVAFADFSGQGISMGIPHHIKILNGVPEAPQTEPYIDETQRTTTHADGFVKTHWTLPAGNDFKGPWEVARPALGSWTNPVLQKEDLEWSDPYNKFLETALIKPNQKATHPRTFQVSIQFIPECRSSCVTYSILKPSDLTVFMRDVTSAVQAFQITGGSPCVVLTLSNVVNPNHVNIADVGRIYP